MLKKEPKILYLIENFPRSRILPNTPLHFPLTKEKALKSTVQVKKKKKTTTPPHHKHNTQPKEPENREREREIECVKSCINGGRRETLEIKQ